MKDTCRVEMLGGLSIVCGDVVFRRFPTQKAATLFAYLAVNLNRSLARDELAEILWPGEELDLGRTRLRRLLNLLKTSLSASLPIAKDLFITVGQRTIQLDGELVATDVREFEQLASTVDDNSAAEQLIALQHARDTYKGDLLPGFYEDWVYAERLRLADIYYGVVSRLANLAEQRGLRDQAVASYARLVELEPLQEEHHLSLIRLLGLRGQTARAVAQYEKLEKLLKEELNEGPSLATKTLIDNIRSKGSDPAKQPPLTAPKPAPALLNPEPVRHLNRLFGREEELREISGSIRSPQSRLTTLVGLSGCGKTRLAQEICQRMADEFQMAVWFVPLAEIESATQIPAAILRSFQLTPHADLSPLDAVAAALGTRKAALLVLDNFEHLGHSGGAEIVRDLLLKAPSLRILVTSLERLNLADENLFQLSPLPVPSRQCNADELGSFPSIQLFEDRAKAANSSFVLGPDNRETVRALCEKLEGLPLAIELAAASAQSKSPNEMLAGINRRFDLLVGNSDATPTRHRSLQSAIEYGFLLLPKKVKEFFVSLSIFEGGWTAESALHVCDQPDAATLLNDLLERSWIGVSSNAATKTSRFEMLETIRTFAAEQVNQEDRHRLRARHSAHFLRAAQNASKHAGASDQAEWLATITADHENFLAALESCRHFGDIEMGLRLALALEWYWQSTGPLSEGRKWFEIFLGASHPSLPTDLHASALAAIGAIAWRQGNFPFAVAAHEKSLSMRREMNDERGIAQSLYYLGITCFRMGDMARTQSLMEESLAICTKIGDDPGIARAVLNLGNIGAETRDFAMAKMYYERSVRIERANGNKLREAVGLHNLGNLAHIQKRFVLSSHYYEEALRIDRSIGSRANEAMCLRGLALSVIGLGQWPRALALIKESIELSKVIGVEYDVASGLAALAKVAVALGDLREAAVYLAGFDDYAQRNSAPEAPTEVEYWLESRAKILAGMTQDELSSASEEGRTKTVEDLSLRALKWIDERLKTF